ncbi:apolipoprotein N-acyltransferase [Palleronia caenipelagi]|uniref:Apolipoprotein N-acyltransferase n=1 Tax=Palleronia caenipelagi TaxID=2489174 RepID=A0A547PR84_9RHOB|nr:apolipoprotein N-acyltransferase [Palleronia caenipelagi]TRD16662.1 apolipoprotein N-acyltransferase [Palleronia caenipelagi]
MPIPGGSSGFGCVSLPVADRRSLALAALAGLAAGLGQAPFSLVPVALAGLALSCWLCRAALSPRRAALIGWVTGTAYFALTLHWIVEPFFVDAARHGWMAPFALIFMSGGLALFWATAFGFARWLAQGRGSFALAFALCLTAAELLRGYIFTGFPWVLVGQIWSDGPGLQLAAFTGPYGLTLVTVVIAAISAVLRPAPALAVVLVGWGGVVGLGALRPDLPMAEPVGTVRLVQPNAPQDQKWDPDLVPVFFRRSLDLSAAEGDVDLVVWPETSLPFLLTGADPILAEISGRAGGVPVIAGAQRREDGRYYNALAVLSAEGALLDVYDKHHLVPFGEYIPFGDVLRRGGLRGLAEIVGGYSAGPGPRVLDLGPLGQPQPLICYEAIFPQEVGAVAARPDWLLQITNDAWFGTFAGPQQHLAIARMRAVEHGLPMLRAANTGISAGIDARGRVIGEIPMGVAGHLDVALPPPGPETLYARTGDWPVAVLLLLMISALGAWRIFLESGRARR